MRKTVLLFDPDAEWYRERLSTAVPAHTYVAATTVEQAIALGKKAEILVGLAPRVTAEMVAAMPDLEWIHALTTGVDNFVSMPEIGPDVTITASRGIHGPQMSELAILMMMALARDFPKMLDNQKRRSWQRWPQPLLSGKTVCIIGLGAIAETLAPRCAAFGMRVVGVSSGRTAAPGFDAVYPRAKITAAAAEADFVVVLVPHSPETHHIVDEPVLAAMKPAAFLINIARGGCVDEAALLRALSRGSIAGAAVDAFQTEPLPEDSPWWMAPNVIVTPHIGGMSDIYREQVLPLTIANLRGYATEGSSGLNNIVDRATGVAGNVKAAEGHAR